MKRSLFVVCMVLAVGTGCEKATSSGTPSGALKPDEVALLRRVPGGNLAVFGGDFARFQAFTSSPLFTQMLGDLGMDSGSMKAWSECFAKRQVTMAGGVAGRPGDMHFFYAMKGMTTAHIDECAKLAKYPAKVDPDGKYVGVEISSVLGPKTSGYFAVADDVLIMQYAMQGTSVDYGDRATLEGTQTALAKGTAADDAKLVALLEKVDRARAMWFAASAEGTMIADKVRTASGWIDAGNGLSFDVKVEVAKSELADEIEKGIPQVRQSAGMLGPELKSVVEGLRFDRSGSVLHFGVDISESQLEALFEKLGPMMRGMGAH